MCLRQRVAIAKLVEVFDRNGDSGGDNAVLLFSPSVTLTQNLLMGGLFTIVSIIRSRDVRPGVRGDPDAEH